MKKVLWFSRHAPTAAQLAEIASNGEEIAAISDGQALGNRVINDDADRCSVVTALRELATLHAARSIYGVFATPVLESAIADETGICLLSAWNIQRCVEGGKLTFEHKKFCVVGWL